MLPIETREDHSQLPWTVHTWDEKNTFLQYFCVFNETKIPELFLHTGGHINPLKTVYQELVLCSFFLFLCEAASVLGHFSLYVPTYWQFNSLVSFSCFHWHPFSHPLLSHGNPFPQQSLLLVYFISCGWIFCPRVMSVQHMHAWCKKRSEEGPGSPRTGVGRWLWATTQVLAAESESSRRARCIGVHAQLW